MLFMFESLPNNMNVFTKVYILISNLFIIGHDQALFLAIDNTGSLFYSTSVYSEEQSIDQIICITSCMVNWIGICFLYYSTLFT